MDFECACDLGVDETSEMIEEKTIKARKEHKCGECGATIKTGEEYYSEKSVYEGRFDTYKTCLPCKEVRDKYLTRGWFWEQIWSDLRECLCGDIPLQDFEKFSPAAQQKILENL